MTTWALINIYLKGRRTTFNKRLTSFYMCKIYLQMLLQMVCVSCFRNGSKLKMLGFVRMIDLSCSAHQELSISTDHHRLIFTGLRWSQTKKTINDGHISHLTIGFHMERFGKVITWVNKICRGGEDSCLPAPTTTTHPILVPPEFAELLLEQCLPKPTC